MFKRKRLKAINALIPKNSGFVYAVPHTNGRKDCYDIINYSSDNLLCVLNDLINCEDTPKMTIFLECFSQNRLDEIRHYIRQKNKSNFKIVPILAAQTVNDEAPNTVRLIKNTLKRFRCKYWFSDTGYVHFQEKTNSQKYVCFNYSTPFKIAVNITDENNFSNCDGYIETSLMTALTHSAEFKINLENCVITGFPRNDSLFRHDRRIEVLNWIKSKVDFQINKIIVYAPTYRDYEGAYDDCCVLGFPDETNMLEEFLSRNGYIIVLKMHPFQKINTKKITPHIIKYEPTYLFGLYDLLSESDMLISDYSSVIHDYILTGKSIILDLFDRRKYDESRGFAFEPIDYICPGPIVDNIDSFISEVSKAFVEDTEYSNYDTVKKMFHRFIDDRSTNRVSEYLLNNLWKGVNR